MQVFGAPNFSALGTRVLIVTAPGPPSVAHQGKILALARELRGEAGVLECVPAMNNITFYVDDGVVRLDELQALIRSRWPQLDSNVQSRTLHTIPVRYAGEDLSEVAQRSGLRADEVIALHAQREYVAYFLGFQPGFAYLGDLDPRLRVPRRAQPRARVERGSVAIAGAMTAVYPFASPGGWNVIGTTSAVIFDPRLTDPVLFAPGDRVRFVPC